MRKQQGFSLVELMISITIGLILMTGVVQLFLSSRATFSTQQALARVQETGRLAMEFLADDIRMAGYLGCMSRNMSFTNTLNDASSLTYDFGTAIEGVDDIPATPPAEYPADMKAGTDALVVRAASGDRVDVTKNNDSSQLFAQDTGVQATCDAGEDSYSGLCENDILVVSDCSKARVFQATNLQASGGSALEINVVHSQGGSALPGNAISSWGGQSNPEENFGPDSEIIKMVTSVYYVADSVVTPGVSSLWQKINGDVAEELLQGVQDMQLTYGRDTTGDGVPDAYQEADVITAANAWSDVRAVRVQLLVQSSEDNVLEDPQPYTFNGVTNNAPGDRRLRQVFINTVAIRSRLP